MLILAIPFQKGLKYDSKKQSFEDIISCWDSITIRLKKLI